MMLSRILFLDTFCINFRYNGVPIIKIGASLPEQKDFFLYL